MSIKRKDKRGERFDHQKENINADQSSIDADVGEGQPAGAFVERLYGEQAKWIIPFVLVVGCVMIYYQSIGFEFINFDDNLYVYNNPVTAAGLSWPGIQWAFTSFHATNWHPLTWLSHQLDSTLFGGIPGYHHLMNAFYHTINSILVFFTIRLLTGSTWRSGIVAAIFAFHPGHVESVAWVSERKDVLSTMFLLLAIFAYTKYARADRSAKWYFLVIVFFLLGLLSKPMIVTLPFILLLLDYWPLRRIETFDVRTLKPLLIEKIPLFLMIIGSSIVTFMAQRSGGAVMPLEALSLSMRITNALISYVRYLGTLLYPVNLAGWYPYPESYPWWQTMGAVLIVGGITYYVINEFKTRRYLATGWFWYLGTLVPVIGLIQVGAQSYADRYTYVPFIGLSIAIVWFVADIVKKYNVNKDAVTAGVAVIVVAMGVLSFRQASFWKDNETFYQHTLAITERTYIFQHNYCNYLLRASRLEEAETQCRNSIESNSNYLNSWVSLGVVLMQRGNKEEALKAFERAWQIQPDDVQSYANLVNALIALKRYDEAYGGIDRLERWNGNQEEIDNRLYNIYKMIGFSLGVDGHEEKAIYYLRKAVVMNTLDADVHSNLGMLLYNQGKTDEAYGELMSSLGIKPEQADIQNAVGRMLLLQGKNAEAVEYFKKALQIDPNSENASKNLKLAESAEKKKK